MWIISWQSYNSRIEKMASLCVHFLIAVTILRTTAGFYVPGVAPIDFSKSQNIPVKAIKMTSSHTQLPFEYYSLPFCQPKEGKCIRASVVGDSVQFYMYLTFTLKELNTKRKTWAKSSEETEYHQLRTMFKWTQIWIVAWSAKNQQCLTLTSQMLPTIELIKNTSYIWSSTTSHVLHNFKCQIPMNSSTNPVSGLVSWEETILTKKPTSITILISYCHTTTTKKTINIVSLVSS